MVISIKRFGDAVGGGTLVSLGGGCSPLKSDEGQLTVACEPVSCGEGGDHESIRSH